MRLKGNGTFAFGGGVVWRNGGAGGESSTSPSSGEDGAWRLLGLPFSGDVDAARFGGVEYILPSVESRKDERSLHQDTAPFPYLHASFVALCNPYHVLHASAPRVLK